MKILSDQELVAKYNCFKTCLAGGGIWGTSSLVLWADVGFGVLGNLICKSNEPFLGEGQRSKLPVVWFSCLMLFGSSTVRTSNPGNQCAWTKVAICRLGDREPTWLSQLPWTVTLSWNLPSTLRSLICRCQGHSYTSRLDFATAWASWALHTVNLVPLFPAVRNSDFGYFCCSIVSKVSSADFRTQLCSLWQWFVHDISSSQPSRIIPPVETSRAFSLRSTVRADGFFGCVEGCRNMPFSIFMKNVKWIMCIVHLLRKSSMQFQGFWSWQTLLPRTCWQVSAVMILMQSWCKEQLKHLTCHSCHSFDVQNWPMRQKNMLPDTEAPPCGRKSVLAQRHFA